jgi:pimeloyl-ACP methyl ester carboxylesterase
MSFNSSSLVGLAALLLVGLIIAIIAMTAYTIYLLTHPPRRTYASALARGRPGDPGELDPGLRGKRPFTSWTFQHGGLDLPVWDIQGDKPDGPIVILSHGWGDSRIGGLTRTPALATHASRLILWDMPGHGEAKGTCALGTREVGALLTLIERIGAPVVLFGWSLGAGVSIAAAVQTDSVKGVIAEAPYRLPWTPARNVLASFGLPFRINLPLAMGILGLRFGLGPMWPGFDRAALAAKLRAPLLVIHGALDTICPVQDGRDIAGAAPHHDLLILDNGAHHSIWTDPQFAEPCTKALHRFLASMP